MRVARQMLGQDGTGSIVNISSGAGHPAGSPTLVSYGAAKCGLDHLTKSLAQEWGPKIRVNCLALGPTMTENFERLVLGDDGASEAYFENVPIRRAGQPEEIGNAVVFLCSGQADTINGTTIYTDGGMLPGALYERGSRADPQDARGGRRSAPGRRRLIRSSNHLAGAFRASLRRRFSFILASARSSTSGGTPCAHTPPLGSPGCSRSRSSRSRPPRAP